MERFACVILAAGLSTRMKSRVSKVLHLLAGKEVISYSIEAAKLSGASRVIVVHSPNQRDLKAYLKGVGVNAVVQKKALGTANAVQAAKSALSNFSGYVLVLYGDVPLVRPEVLREFVETVQSKGLKLGIITMILPDGANYGRVVRDLDGRLTRIVEAPDANPEELKIREVNTGIYCVEKTWLFNALKKVKNDNSKGEYYLTDLVGLALKEGASVLGKPCGTPGDFLGINTYVDMALVAEEMRYRINRRHMLEGVCIFDFRHTIVDADVEIGTGTTVMPFSLLIGDTKVGKDCTIENGVLLKDARIGGGVHIKAYSVIEGSKIEDGAVVGPFSRIRPESRVGREARVGNFVELKKSELKEGAKANHLTYLGDAYIGARANIGCGTITCNYDGIAKHRTIVGEGVFVGSDTQFVAPVRIGKGATIGAGSTITKDVPAGALALSRSPQVIVRGWSKRRRKK